MLHAGGVGHRLEKMKSVAPYLGMVIAQTAQVGLIIVSKEAMSNGMSKYVFVTYSNALASLILLPTSFLAHRCLYPNSHKAAYFTEV